MVRVSGVSWGPLVGVALTVLAMRYRVWRPLLRWLSLAVRRG